jgi:predicted negative regulator of RcsB-dependent stress response
MVSLEVINMSIQKQKFTIIVLAGVVLAGGGMIGYKFYQEKQNEAVIETQQQVQEEASQVASGIVETKVISAEMNPTQENIEAAEEAVTSIPERGEKQKLLNRIASVKEEFNKNLKVKEEARLAELEDDINQAKIALHIDQAPSEKDLLEILHNMTHQKVRSEEKWGFVQINEVNLLAVKEVLQENPAFNQNIDMLAIVTDWLNNDFGNVVAEHNSIWKMKNGSVGKAYGILSPSEEAALVREQFGVKQ